MVRAIEELKNAAETDWDPRVRRAAVMDLGQIKQPDALDALVEILADAIARKDAYEQQTAVKALTLLTGRTSGANLEAWQHHAVDYRKLAEQEAEASEEEPSEEEASEEEASAPEDSVEEPALN